MILTCKCLNISIDIEETDIEKCDVETLNLSPVEKSVQFFNEAVGVGKLVKWSQTQLSLVDTECVGIWKIYKCINCMLCTHGLCKNDDKMVVVNLNTIRDTNVINRLKTHKNYSPVYRILIKHLNEEDKTGKTARQQTTPLVGSIQITMSSLQHQLSKAVQEEVIKTEEKIRIYSDQQLAALEEFRQRAHNDHNALVRHLHGLQEKSKEENAQNLPHKSISSSVAHGFSKSFTLPNIESKTEDGASRQTFPKTESPKKIIAGSTLSSPIGTGRRPPVNRSMSMFVPGHGGVGSYDSEVLFDIEGMEDNSTEPYHSEGESETDHEDSGSHDEGIDLHRKRAGSVNLAKSLPVNVPVYLPSGTVAAIDIENEREPLDPTDIAASIKALARSVHGDAVFGDLPRPRFSTQI